MRHARGEWLAFLDQDDIWLPRKLELQLALTAADVGMVYGRTVLFHAGDRNLRDYDYAHEFTPLPEGNIFPALFRDACFIAMSSALLRRTAVVECGGIPSAVEIIPDHYLYAAIAARHKVRAVQQVVARYRVHAGNMSRRNRNRIYAGGIVAAGAMEAAARSAHLWLSPHDIFHRAGVGRDEVGAQRGTRAAKIVWRWLAAVAGQPSVRAGLARVTSKAAHALLAAHSSWRVKLTRYRASGWDFQRRVATTARLAWARPDL